MKNLWADCYVAYFHVILFKMHEKDKATVVYLEPSKTYVAQLSCKNSIF